MLLSLSMETILSFSLLFSLSGSLSVADAQTSDVTTYFPMLEREISRENERERERTFSTQRESFPSTGSCLDLERDSHKIAWSLCIGM